MKSIRILLTVLFCYFITKNVYADASGVVNFNLGKSPVADSPVQPVTLFGCNEAVNTNLFWDTNNQLVGDIPYGYRSSDSKKDYFVSKYYIASPPAYRQGLAQKGSKASIQKPPYIGLVTPDRFKFSGTKPAQIVYFDYRILEPTAITFVPMDYKHKNEDGVSCASLGVDSIPVSTQCDDFPWRNGALGASGIGDITRENDRVFLPLIGDGKQQKALNCSVSILHDIMLDHDVYFLDKNNENVRSQSLSQYHGERKGMKLVCFKRVKSDIPAGCKP